MRVINPARLFINPAKKELKLRVGLHKAMIRREAEMGGELFGSTPEGRRREFFCLDTNTWVWHEEWQDNEGVWQRKTTRYDIKSDGVYKSQQGASYKKITVPEAVNLYNAIGLYASNVAEPLYGYTRRQPQ